MPSDLIGMALCDAPIFVQGDFGKAGKASLSKISLGFKKAQIAMYTKRLKSCDVLSACAAAFLGSAPKALNPKNNFYHENYGFSHLD
ncbi:hypothetical protein HCU40_11035 [Pseudanabaena biceps]|nr:hypothetical protein [Pseudanabaena biceps]